MFAGTYLGVGCLGFTLLIARRLGIGARITTGAVGPAWLVALLAAIVTLALDVVVGGTWVPATGLSQRAGAGIRFLTSSTVFAALFLLGARLVLGSHLEDELEIIPARLRSVARRILRFPATAPEGRS